MRPTISVVLWFAVSAFPMFLVAELLGEAMNVVFIEAWMWLACLWLVVVVVAFNRIAKRPKRARILITGIVATLWGGILVVGWQVGAKSGAAAFNECVESGGAVRVALSRFHDAEGSYPAALHEVYEQRVPCSRAVLGSILRYQRVDDGYELRFSDWMITHEATAEEPFAGWKN